ncbi:MAG: LysR substrate-binding domain-containing protein, partial [Pseudomonadota bacterium]
SLNRADAGVSQCRPMVGVDLTSLRYFIGVARSGSIAEAARREAVAASALSRRIAELEARLRTPLLVRSANGVTLTPAGETVREHGRRILDLVARLESEIADHQAGERGEVRIAASGASLSGVLADDLAAFETAHPRTRITLSETSSRDAVQRVEDGLADFGVVVDFQIPSALERTHYEADPIWVIGRSGHPVFDDAPPGRPIRFADAVQHDIIALEGGAAIDALTIAAASAIDRQLHKQFVVDRYDSLRRLVEVGLGIGFIRRSGFLPFAGVLAIDGRPLADQWADRRLCLISRGDGSLTPAAELVFSFLSGAAEARQIC